MSAVDCGVRQGEPAVTLRRRRLRRDVPARMRDARARRCGSAATSTSRGRARSTPFRAGSRDRASARASLGQPARVGTTAPRAARVDLRGLELPTDQRAADARQPPRRFDVRTIDAARTGARLVGPTRLRRPTRARCVRSRSRTSSPSMPRLDERGLTAHDASRADGRARGADLVLLASRSSGSRAGAARDWELRWPACEHVEVDDRVIPTGARTASTRRARADRRPHLRRSLRARTRPSLLRRGEPGARCGSRSTRLSLRAALRAASRRVRRDRADDRRRSTRSATATRRSAHPATGSAAVHHRAATRDAVRLLPPGATPGSSARCVSPTTSTGCPHTGRASPACRIPGRADWALLHGRASATSCASPTTRSPTTRRRACVTAYRLQDLVSGGNPVDPDRERAIVAAAAADVVAHVSAASVSPCTAWAGAAAPARSSASRSCASVTPRTPSSTTCTASLSAAAAGAGPRARGKKPSCAPRPERRPHRTGPT